MWENTQDVLLCNKYKFPVFTLTSEQRQLSKFRGPQEIHFLFELTWTEETHDFFFFFPLMLPSFHRTPNSVFTLLPNYCNMLFRCLFALYQFYMLVLVWLDFVFLKISMVCFLCSAHLFFQGLCLLIHGCYVKLVPWSNNRLPLQRWFALAFHEFVEAKARCKKDEVFTWESLLFLWNKDGKVACSCSEEHRAGFLAMLCE